jgi:hypothetical protein
MKPLIDGDVLRYEIGAKCEGSEEHGPLHFDRVADMIYGSIHAICRAAGGDEPPVIYLTGGENFRNDIAVTKPYKGNRKSHKPFHWHNISAYLRNQYEVREVPGLEADDLMGLDQLGMGEGSIICTRDKDLRIIPGWQYGWECGAQREFGPLLVDYLGGIELDTSKKQAKIVGTGMTFFYSQLLTGDSVDNIPGLPRCGPVKAYEILDGVYDEAGMFKRVRAAYQEKGFDDEYLLEQGRLLWMTRELHDDGSPVLWELPEVKDG